MRVDFLEALKPKAKNVDEGKEREGNGGRAVFMRE